MKLDGQQWIFRNVRFQGTATGVVAGGTDIVFLGCSFKNGKVGIDAEGTSGSLTVIDSHGSGLGSLITSSDSGNAGNAIILENVKSEGTTVRLDGNSVLHGDVMDTWVHGTLVSHSANLYIRPLANPFSVCPGGEPQQASIGEACENSALSTLTVWE